MQLAARMSVLYPYPIADRYVLTRDGARIMEGTEQEIWTYLHANHSASVTHLLTHEGYRMEAMVWTRRTFIVEAAWIIDDTDTTAPMHEVRVRATSAEHAEDLASQRHREFNYFRAVSPAHLCVNT